MKKNQRRLSQAIALASLACFAACTKAQVAGPPKEKVFRFAFESKVTSLDPHVTTDVYSAVAQSLVYESLYQYHYSKRPYEIVPMLAAALPEFSKDRKRLTIHLKKGVLFQDDACFAATQGKGREMTADDVVYMFERVAGTKIASPIWGSFEHRIEGIDDFHSGKAKTIAGVKALDRYTVEIDLLQTLPRFIYNFVDPKTAIVPKECVEALGDEFARHPVGTGPFHLTEVNLSAKFVGVRNPNYKHMVYPVDSGSAQAGKPLPLADKVVFEVITEKQPAFLKFLAGEFEMSSIPKDFIPKIVPNNKLSPELAARGVTHIRAPRGDVTVHTFNMEDPVWGKNKDLRHAFELALDIPKMIQVQYSGQAIPAESIFDPTMYGYDPKFKSKWTTRNIPLAKQLLAKAGYPDAKGLPPINFPTNEDTTTRQLDELLQRQLGEVGITLKLEPMTWPEFEKRQRDRNFTVVGMGYASGMPDVDDSTGLVLSRNIPSNQNPSGYRDPAMDKLIDDIEATPNGPARLAKIHRFLEIMDDQLPIAPMVHRIANQLYQPWVKNPVFIDNVLVGAFAKYIDVQTAAESK